MIEKLAVRNPELPTASTDLMTKLRAMKTVPFSIWSSNPNRMEQRPVVKMPALKTLYKKAIVSVSPFSTAPPRTYLFAPNFPKFLPTKGLTMKTVSSKMPNTNPYCEGVTPFFSASFG